MATDGEVSFWDGVAYNAVDFRQLDSPLLMPGPASAPFSSRSGRQVNGAGLAVTVAPAGNGSVSVSAGAGVIYDNAHAIQGAWRFTIPTAKTGIALPARPGVGTSRIDLVVARIYDSGIGVGAVKEVKIEVISGAAAASPSAPALPALSFELGRLTVSATSGAAIPLVSTTQVTTAAGGILPVATTTERNALVTAGIAYRGLVVDNAQTGNLEKFESGTTWRTLHHRAIDGTASVSAPGVDFTSPTTTNISFPAGLFSAAPNLTFGLPSTGARCVVTVTSKSATAATLTAYNTTSAAAAGFTFDWLATEF